MKGSRTLAKAFAAGAAASVVALALYVAHGAAQIDASGDPGPSPFMRAERCEVLHRIWRPLDEIDPRLACAVILAEDARFHSHAGVDWSSLGAAMRANWKLGKMQFGAGTIPMQVARLRLLGRERSIERTLAEIPLTLAIARRLERRRLLELYLNDAWWAPCVYGAEAAAQHFFGHGAEVLRIAEATELAALLPEAYLAPPADPAGAPQRASLTLRRSVVRRQHALLAQLSAAGVLGAGERLDGIRDMASAGLLARPVGDPAPPAPERPWPAETLTSGCGLVTPSAEGRSGVQSISVSD